MARISLALFVVVITIAVLLPASQQAPQNLNFNPFNFNPFYFPFNTNINNGDLNNVRLFFGPAASLLAGRPLITRFTTTTTTATSTTSVTCTRPAVGNNACNGAYPFALFTGRNLLDSFEPSPVIKTEVTELPDVARALSAEESHQQPYVLVGAGPFLLNPSFHHEQPPYFNGVMPRQLGGVTTVTFTVTTVSWSTSTRSITPNCNAVGYFTPC